jgi:hypothetical protein
VNCLIREKCKYGSDSILFRVRLVHVEGQIPSEASSFHAVKFQIIASEILTNEVAYDALRNNSMLRDKSDNFKS